MTTFADSGLKGFQDGSAFRTSFKQILQLTLRKI